MRPTALAAVALAVLGGCSPSADSAESPERSVEREDGAAVITGGNRYDKGSYVDDAGRTVLSFRLRVENVGDRAGGSSHPACYVVIENERYDLQIYENPELAPGVHGWFRTGGPVPRLDARELDNVEPHCDF